MLALVFATTLLAAPVVVQEEPKERLEHSSLVRFVGTVVTPAGLPARGAVVESSAGGRAVADADGRFELAVDVPFDARSVEVTATAAGRQRASATASARVLPAAFAPTTSVGTLVVAPGASAPGRWRPTFGGLPGVNGDVLALTVFDDGNGAALYLGGAFTSAGGIEVQKIVRWDGEHWSALGAGVTGIDTASAVEALAVFDDGGGPALYAAGTFLVAGGAPANRVARWDGTSWSSLGSGLDGTVRALAVFDDGSGPALYATGTFTTAGGVPASSIARWNGTTWSALGSGITGNVGRALEVFDDGSGEALYVAGNFTAAGGVPADRIARWDGSTWQALGGGLDDVVFALRAFDDGSGPALYAAGRFDGAGGSPADEIARWNGAGWTAVGGGMAGGRLTTLVHSLLVLDTGGGARLFAAGDFTSAGGVPAQGAASWDGASWTAVGDGETDFLFTPYALAAFDRGAGPELHVGGTIWPVEGTPQGVARLDGAQWKELGRGPGGTVRALLPVDLDGSRQVYVAGHFASMGGVPANNVARWDGSTWSALGSGTTAGPSNHSSTVFALALYDDGGGTDLYAGGSFEGAGGVPAQGIARFDGASWSAVGTGFHGYARAFQVFDDGSGPALYTGGESAPPARWNGASWANIKHGINGTVYAWAVFDDGSGPALYAGGAFTSATSGTLNHVARWTGAGWAPLGSGTPATVFALAVFDDGTGPALYAAGDNPASTGFLAPITRWNGTSWSSVGSGFSLDVYALAVIDDGRGRALFAGGSFYTADGVAARSIARWDGTSWSPLGAGLGPIGAGCLALAQFEDEGFPTLLAGGAFDLSPARDSYLAQWGAGKVIRKTR